jgi:hypothetical protein
MTQPDLFTSRPVVRSSPTLSAPERRRLSSQCERILALLHRGPATNRQLSDLALNYKARVSDLRKAGYRVECVDRNTRTGFSRYRLGE